MKMNKIIDLTPVRLTPRALKLQKINIQAFETKM